MCAALALSSGAAAAPSRDSDTATVALSSDRAGARPVTMTVKLGTELQCGRLAGRTLEIRLPSQARIPNSVPASAILVGSSHPTRVTVTGKTLSLGIGVPARQVICNVITPGVVKIVVGRGANLGNPARPGTYRLVFHRGTQVITASVSIR